MPTKKSQTQGEKLLLLEAGLDFQNRESKHILETVRYHHTEILELQEKVDDLLSVVRIFFVAVILSVIVIVTIYTYHAK